MGLAQFLGLDNRSKTVTQKQPLPVSNETDVVVKKVTFTGAAGAGAVGTIDLFSVTEFPIGKVYVVCSVDLVSAGAGHIKVGDQTQNDIFCADIAATDLDANETWFGSGVPSRGNTGASASFVQLINGKKIILTVSGAAVTAGEIYVIAQYDNTPTDAVITAL